MKKNQFETYAVVFINKGNHGFNHINVRLGNSHKDEVLDTKQGDLPFSLSSDNYKNICFNIQYNVDDDNEGYGYAPVIHDVYNLNLNDAEETIKILRRVTKQYDELRGMRGVFDPLESLIAFFEAAKVKRVFIRHHNVVGFVNVPTYSAIKELAIIDANLGKGSL